MMPTRRLLTTSAIARGSTVGLASFITLPFSLSPSVSIHSINPSTSPSNAPTRSQKDNDLIRRYLSPNRVAKGRPSIDDVERLSRGEAAKKRGTGSRSICHRLNEMERKEFDLAKKMGFVQLRGTGYRRERKGSPLANIHRQLCDAMARPCIEIHRGLGTNAIDEVIVDVSTFRPTESVNQLEGALEILMAVDAELGRGDIEEQQGGKEALMARWDVIQTTFDEEDWEKKPIWDLPVISYVYDCTGDRALTKKIAQEVHVRMSKLPKEVGR